jgi:hypothetical protein
VVGDLSRFFFKFGRLLERSQENVLFWLQTAKLSFLGSADTARCLTHFACPPRMTTAGIQGESSLPPEHRRALHFAMAQMESLRTIHFLDLSDSIWRQGQVAAVTGSFGTKHIPRGEDWRWNQTRSRQRVTVTKGNTHELVEFWKMVPRKLIPSSVTPIPSIKLWIFSFGPEPSQTHLLWCERGISSPPSPSSSSSPYKENKEEPSDTNTLSEEFLWQLVFLRPLMDANTAEEIWPSTGSPLKKASNTWI